MKRYISKYIAFAAALILCAACEDDADLTVLEDVQFSSELEASTSSVTLMPENEEESVNTFSWPEVTYPVEAPVQYTLQFDVPADTIGANAWANATTVEAGTDVLSKAFQGGEFNSLVTDLGLSPGEQGTIVVRVMSSVDRPAYSQPITVTVIPYTVFTGYPALWVAGDFQGWDVTTAPTIVSVNDDSVYEGYIYIPAGGTNEFKLYAQPAWEPLSYGDGGDGKLIEANYAGGNLIAPSDGYYLLSVNLNDMTYMLMKTTWGLIGGATPGGWDSDTPMTYDSATQTWTVTADMKANDSFKFRANNAWQLDFGIDGEGDLAYANHPLLPYVDQPQLSVPEDGNYTITLDLHEPGNYAYKIKKN